MKTRSGFVSNSSSQSFIIDMRYYGDVFGLAKHMLEIRNEDWLEEGYPQLANKPELERLAITKRDRNTPVAFKTCNFDTYILRAGQILAVETCNNHPFFAKLKGGLHDGVWPELYRILGLDQEDICSRSFDIHEEVENGLSKVCSFWWPEIDLVCHEEEEEGVHFSEQLCKKHFMFEKRIKEGPHKGKLCCPWCLREKIENGETG